MNIAAQLYTLRQFTKTPADIARTLARVKKLGYDAVQCSALGPIEPRELDRMLRGEGLACCATHVPLERLKAEPQHVIEEHRLWGCKYAALSGLFQKTYTTDDWLSFARVFNEIGGQFEGSGVRLGYHNHSHELARFDGKTALQILLERLDASIWFEIDTYWVQHGGGDPAAWIGKVAGRVPCVHLKDMAVHPDRTQFMAEVGEGNLNWPAILDACRSSEVEWLIIEQDTCYRDPFESLGISLKNLNAMLSNRE